MMYHVHITEQAFEDMNNIYRYIFDTLQAPNAAKKQYNRIANAIKSLNLFPERIKLIDSCDTQSNQLRKMNIDNYSIFFTIEGKAVTVLSILYSATDITNRLKGIIQAEQ